MPHNRYPSLNPQQAEATSPNNIPTIMTEHVSGTHRQEKTISLNKDITFILSVKVHIPVDKHDEFFSHFTPTYEKVIAEEECRFFVSPTAETTQPLLNVTCVVRSTILPQSPQPQPRSNQLGRGLVKGRRLVTQRASKERLLCTVSC
jgi:hypothetical protein